MRAVECAVPKCAHIHAINDEQLAHELMRHAASVHEAMEVRQARQIVEAAAYEDTRHSPRKTGFPEFLGRAGAGLYTPDGEAQRHEVRPHSSE